MINKSKIITVKADGVTAGRLGLNSDGVAVFEYDEQFLKTGFSLSPFFLPLRTGVFTSNIDPFSGMFGVFSDSLPDGWGRLLIDRLLANNKVNITGLSELDRLSITGSHGMGALEYFPQTKISKKTSSADVEELAAEVGKVLGEKRGADIDLLVNKEGSSGGAKPKAIIKSESSEWIVKFPNSNDREDIGIMEYEYSLAAKKCGIAMTDTKLFDNKYYGIKRFDREKKKKVHTISAAALFNVDFRIPSLDYTLLLRGTMVISKDITEVIRLFRLMVFNVLAKNRDDHAKKFTFIYKEDRWLLSPAYDLVYSSGFNGQHTTMVSGSGLPNKKEIMEVAKSAGINKKSAELVYEEVSEGVKGLKKFFK